jgi:lysyl-tRNA synthetase class 1
MGPMSSSSGNTIGPIEALGLVPPEIIRYLIAGSKVNKHIDFDTGGALFTMADEYERLVANPPSGDAEKLSKRQLIARDTKLGALRMSQIIHGTDPADSVAGVSFRHLSMLAQIKSDDEGIWNSLRQSSHIDGMPNQNLINRLARMRNWIEGPHFPTDAQIIIQSAITEEARDNLSTEQNSFLSEFQKRIIDYEWNESSINECIRESAAAVEIGMRQAYMALYWTILGKYFGPRIAALMSEIDKDEVMAIFSN